MIKDKNEVVAFPLDIISVQNEKRCSGCRRSLSEISRWTLLQSYKSTFL